MQDAESSGANSRAKKWSLSGTTALVTGGTKGIGHAIVEELAGFGATVHTCSRNEAELNKCLERWKTLNIHVTGSVCDVSKRAEREKLMEDVRSIFQGKLNVLVNNAGTGIPNSAVDSTAEEYSFQMATNLESAFHLSQLAHPLLKASGAGSIVFISSIAGVLAFPNLSIYSATKGALNQLTKNLACEWIKDNIRVNCVAPGPIRTPLMQPIGGRDIRRPLSQANPCIRDDHHVYRGKEKKSFLKTRKPAPENSPAYPWGALENQRRWHLLCRSYAYLLLPISRVRLFVLTEVGL